MADPETTRQTLLHIADRAIEAVSPGPAMRSGVKRQGNRIFVDGVEYDLADFERVLILGAGKASAAMAQALEDILGDRLTFGMVVTKYGHGLTLHKTEVLEAGHPVPDAAGERAAGRLLDLAEAVTENDLVFCLISGGASALVPAPIPPVTLAHKQATTRKLLQCGATINEINAIRKHLSRFKGGRLAKALEPATVVTLIISDVVGDHLDVIASGPTAPDESTFADCRAIVDRYGLCGPIPDAVDRLIAEGNARGRPETCKAGDSCFDRVQNVIIAGNAMALEGAAQAAREQGYTTVITDRTMEGEAREVARRLVRLAGEYCAGHHGQKPPVCLLAGGETTVTIQGNGKGGRNQEFALAAAIEMAGMREYRNRLAVISLGTDGTDGPTDAAGALALPGTVSPDRIESARAHLDNNNAYAFFTETGTLLKTGPTRTNVMDVAAILVDPDERLS